jgi:hypothetical protein
VQKFQQAKVIPVEQGLSVTCKNIFEQVVTSEGKPAKKTAAKQKSLKPPRLPLPP